ncbi:MAG TPA: GrpB family protein [Solirubrobacteraceae bacterium]|nr:GrpB family protein [Solirubrobacteraceae bacterium]
MAVVRIRPAAELRLAVAAAIAAHSARIGAALPGVEIEHVGSTAIPGALTKGDLDLLVRVPATRFAAAVAALRDRYAVHQPENWTPTYASFVDGDSHDPPVGVQLAVAGSSDDALFAPFRDALIADPALLAQYNALKLSLDGAEYDRYTDAKGAFVERVLAGGAQA